MSEIKSTHMGQMSTPTRLGACTYSIEKKDQVRKRARLLSGKRIGVQENEALDGRKVLSEVLKGARATGKEVRGKERRCSLLEEGAKQKPLGDIKSLKPESRRSKEWPDIREGKPGTSAVPSRCAPPYGRTRWAR